MHIFADSILSPNDSSILEYDDEMETLIENNVIVKLFNSDKEEYYVNL
jgi:hypothetical protein